MKHLIINADDFGYSYSVNKGIVEAHTKGIVTSTTVLVDGIAAREAAGLSKYKDLTVGLHFFPKSGESIDEEFKRQIELFESIVGRRPDSIDTHKQMPSDNKEIKDILKDYSAKFKIPVRGFSYVKFIRTFFGLNVDGSGVLNKDNVSIDSLKRAIDEATDDFNEIMCHVGYSDDYLREHSSYNDIREEELKAMLSLEIREYLKSKKGLKLANWGVVQESVL